MTRSAFLEAMRATGRAGRVGEGRARPEPAAAAERGGDLGAAERIKSCFQLLRRVLMRRGNSQAETEDLIQEAFLRMQEYCEKGGEVHRPEGFLMRTALRLAANARRDAHRELYRDGPVEDLTQLIDCAPTPDEVLAGQQCLMRMRAALDAANPRTREVLFMQRLDGMSYGEIAGRLGISVSAVEKHVAKALVILAELSERE
jgi:RNA polymerase sigma-70 factor (ECF subfamily)